MSSALQDKPSKWSCKERVGSRREADEGLFFIQIGCIVPGRFSTEYLLILHCNVYSWTQHSCRALNVANGQYVMGDSLFIQMPMCLCREWIQMHLKRKKKMKLRMLTVIKKRLSCYSLQRLKRLGFFVQAISVTQSMTPNKTGQPNKWVGDEWYKKRISLLCTSLLPIVYQPRLSWDGHSQQYQLFLLMKMTVVACFKLLQETVCTWDYTDYFDLHDCKRSDKFTITVRSTIILRGYENVCSGKFSHFLWLCMYLKANFCLFA